MNGGNQLQLQVLILVNLSNHDSYRIRPFWINSEFFRCKPPKSLNSQKCWDPSHRDRVLFLGQRPVFFRVRYFPHFDPVDLLQTAFGPSARNIAEEWVFASPGKWGKKWPENGENRPKMAQKCHFWSTFPFFSHFSAHVPGEAITHFAAIFPRFRAEDPKAVCSRSTGS